MRRVGGLLLVVVVACAVLLGAASAGAAEPPEYDGTMDFPRITAPDGPEEYSWRVHLHEGQELRPIDDQSAAVLYTEPEHFAFMISAGAAHDAIGTNVPTTLAVTTPDLITLTVHHREGNPLAGGAPFNYPIIAGKGWEGGVQSPVLIPFPPDEVELREMREREAKAQVPTASAAADAPADAPRPQRLFVTRALGEDKLYYRPHSFLLSGDGSFGVGKVQWQSYGGATATASGRGFANDCIPYCAAGRFYHPQAQLRLSKVVPCQGRSVYSRLHYALSGPLPQGFPRRGGFPMLPLGEDGKPDC